MNEKLKPCPFCGGGATLKKTQFGYYVDCDLEFGYCSVIPKTWGYPTEKEAIHAWNGRYGET